MNSLSLEAFNEKWIARCGDCYRDDSGPCPGVGSQVSKSTSPQMTFLVLFLLLFQLWNGLLLGTSFASLRIVVWLSHKRGMGSKETRLWPLYSPCHQNSSSLCSHGISGLVWNKIVRKGKQAFEVQSHWWSFCSVDTWRKTPYLNLGSCLACPGG